MQQCRGMARTRHVSIAAALVSVALAVPATLGAISLDKPGDSCMPVVHDCDVVVFLSCCFDDASGDRSMPAPPPSAGPLRPDPGGAGFAALQPPSVLVADSPALACHGLSARHRCQGTDLPILFSVLLI